MKQNEDHPLPNPEGDAEFWQAREDDVAVSDDDFSRYLGHIAHLDMPIECKIELLHVLQEIMRSFVDRAFGDDAVQLARKDGDEIQIVREADSAPVVASEDQHSTGDKALTGAFAKRADRAKRKETCPS